MPLTPQITLTATLLDFSGNEIGSATYPAYLRIKLCGYGQTVPCVPGVGMIGKVASDPVNVAYEGAQISVILWGNDVISPNGTYYEIAVLDTLGNVVQSGIYQFSGTETIDLSNAGQIVQPVLNPPIAGLHSFSSVIRAPAIYYTLPYAPRTATPLFLYVGGQFMTVGIDYEITGNVVGFFRTLGVNDVVSGFLWT